MLSRSFKSENYIFNIYKDVNDVIEGVVSFIFFGVSLNPQELARAQAWAKYNRNDKFLKQYRQDLLNDFKRLSWNDKVERLRRAELNVKLIKQLRAEYDKVVDEATDIFNSGFDVFTERIDAAINYVFYLEKRLVFLSASIGVFDWMNDESLANAIRMSKTMKTKTYKDVSVDIADVA
jgi:hypothetical protein